jgi:hypothetical protein
MLAAYEKMLAPCWKMLAAYEKMELKKRKKLEIKKLEKTIETTATFRGMNNRNGIEIEWKIKTWNQSRDKWVFLTVNLHF